MTSVTVLADPVVQRPARCILQLFRCASPGTIETITIGANVGTRKGVTNEHFLWIVAVFFLIYRVEVGILTYYRYNHDVV